MKDMTDEQTAAAFAEITGAQRPGIRPDVAELLDRHRDEADRWRSTPYVPQTPPPAREPMPAWAKGTALAAPAVGLGIGGGIWLASEGVSGVMAAMSPDVLGALALVIVIVALAGQAAAKRSPRRVEHTYDLRGAHVDARSSRGITWKSNNS